ADRSTIPLTLWTLDDLVRALIENYEQGIWEMMRPLLTTSVKFFAPQKK
ncbi:restriction endonuclease, partial [Klebsiella pneumoniae]|nr:restriction endonuclease [Klebsiella pneumoniae]